MIPAHSTLITLTARENKEPAEDFASRVRTLALCILGQALSDIESYIRHIDEQPVQRKSRMRPGANGKLYRDPRDSGYMLKEMAEEAVAWFDTADFKVWLGLAGVQDCRKKFLYRRVRELQEKLASIQ